MGYLLGKNIFGFYTGEGMFHMDKLTNYCNELFIAENTSLYRFCKNHNLERTCIRRLLKGERLPKEDVFEEFANALTLTPQESIKLHELYQRQKLGPVRYENRIFIKDLLEYIGNGHQFHFSQSITSHYNPIAFEKKTIKIDNPLDLSYIFQQILTTEKHSVYSNISANTPFFFQSFQQSFGKRKSSVPFFHILTLLKNTEIQKDVNYNLKVLKNITSFSFQNHFHYQPFYFYGNPTNENATVSFPYYLLTSKYILFLSENCKEGLFSTDAELIQIYHQQCKKMIENAQPFIYYALDPTQMLERFHSALNTTEAPAHPLYTFDFFPCLFKVYSHDLFIPQLTDEYKHNTELIQTIDSLSKVTANFPLYEAFISYEGLLHFTKTGELGKCCSHVLNPFAPAERKLILEKVQSYCADGTYLLHILPKHYFHNSPEISLELYSDHRVSLLSMNQENLFSSFYLRENSIYDAILDYFESLLENPEVSSVEESAKIIQEMIDEYLG